MRTVFARAAWPLWLIFAVALAARLGFAWERQRQIPRDVLAIASFSQETGSIAYALATGKGYSSPFRRETGPTAWLTPVYPLLVAGVFRIFGIFTRASFFAVVFLNAVFSCAVCVAIYQAGKRIAGPGVAYGAAWLWAIFPNAVMVPFEWVWDTALSALLGAAILWATLEVAESPRSRDWCAYGLVWGLALMTNPALGSLLPFLLGWAAYGAFRASREFAVKRAALAAGVAILCCLPWTVRNGLLFHRLIPLRSNFPLELYIGNNENYVQFVYPPKVTKERELLRYLRIGETAFMDEEERKALEFMRAHPGIVLKLTEKRFVEFWTGLPDPLEAFATTDSRIVQVLLVVNTLAGLGALLGIAVLIWRRSPYVFPAVSYPLVFPWVYYITHPNLRYRHPIDPVVLLLVAIAAGSLVKKTSRLDAPTMESNTEN